MTSMNENRSVNETGKYTGMVKQKTKNDLAQGGTDYESLYESLTGHKSKQEKSVFHGMLYLMSFLLVLVFLTAVASLALSLTQFKMSPGSGSAEEVKTVQPAEMKATSPGTKEVTNATLLHHLNELSKQIGEMNANFILSELKLEQKQAITNLTKLVRVHTEEMKAENSHLKDALNFTRLQLEKIKKRVEEMKVNSIRNEFKQQKNAMANLTVLVNNKTGPPRHSDKDWLKVAIKNLANKLENLAVLVNNTPASSCKELYERKPSLKSGVYKLQFGSKEIPVYCHMGDFGCGEGGWTLAMKINGSKKTFHNNSRLWSNKETFNLAGGETGFDKEETKLPTYWRTPFTKICLGMKVNKKDNFVAVNKEACSLHSLIADGKYRATSLGRNKWNSLVGSAGSLQKYCNKEGFNAVGFRYIGARIGILGSGQIGCSSPGSKIGFGTGGYPYNRNTCGYEAIRPQDNGMRHIEAMGYILVQ